MDRRLETSKRPWVAGLQSAGLCPGLAAVLVVAATPVLASAPVLMNQTAAPADAAPEARLDYPADFFTSAQPVTALDMIARLPGFVMDGGGNVRGLSGAQGNVLIDGRRPASKSEDLDDVIRRIPAGQVLRIEVIRGGAPGIDMQGQPVVANIVRRQGGAVEAVLSAGGERHEDGRWAWDGGMEVSRSLSGDRRIEASAQLYRYVDDDAGDGTRERRNGAGALIRSSRAEQTGGGEGGRFTAAWLQPLAGGTLAANGLLSAERYEWTLEDRLSPPASGVSILDETEDELELELGANWVRPLAAGRLELVVLQTLGDEVLVSRAAGPGGRERFDSEERIGESIGRVSVSRILSPRLTVEAGLEGAFNWREGRASADEDGTAIDLPASDVRVEERRAELVTTAAWRPTDRLSVEAGLRVETSELSQSGQNSTARSLTFAKPRLNAVWTPDAESEWRVRLEREVGQLNFGDFITSASLDTEQVSAGNADLMPAARWVAEAVYERRFWEEGALTLTLMHEAIENAVDRVPVFTTSGVFDAPGNIGDAERRRAEVRLALPLGRLGMAGGLFRTSLEWVHTEATDPTTGERRPMSGAEPFEAQAELVQDLPARKLRWGVSAYFGSAEEDFRFDQTSREFREPWWSAFTEWRARPDLVLKVEIENITGRGRKLERVIHAGPRDTAPVLLTELRQQAFGPYLSFSLRRTFG